MSYHQQRTLVRRPRQNPALGDDELDKTVGSGTDFIATWTLIQQRVNDKLGLYKYNDGTLARVGGKTVPMMPFQHAEAFATFMTTLGKRMVRQGSTMDRPTTSLSAAIARFQTGWTKFRAKVGNSPTVANKNAGRMPIEDVAAFNELVTVFSIEASTGLWSAFNIATKREMVDQAIKETPGGALIKPFMFGFDALSWLLSGSGEGLVGVLTTTAKVVGVGLLAYGGYRGYQILKGKETPA